MAYLSTFERHAMNEGMQKGLQLGKQEGFQEATQKVVLKLLENNLLSIDQITQITGVSTQEIQALKTQTH